MALIAVGENRGRSVGGFVINSELDIYAIINPCYAEDDAGSILCVVLDFFSVWIFSRFHEVVDND